MRAAVWELEVEWHSMGLDHVDAKVVRRERVIPPRARSKHTYTDNVAQQIHSLNTYLPQRTATSSC